MAEQKAAQGSGPSDGLWATFLLGVAFHAAGLAVVLLVDIPWGFIAVGIGGLMTFVGGIGLGVMYGTLAARRWAD